MKNFNLKAQKIISKELFEMGDEKFWIHFPSLKNRVAEALKEAYETGRKDGAND